MPPTDAAAETPRRPLPLADETTAPFWDAAREHRLTVQRCDSCARYQHLPLGFCPVCGTAELSWKDVSGRAKLYSYTVMHDAPAPGFAGHLPYIVAVAELEEQENLLITTNLVDADPADLSIGLPLEVTFEELAPGDVVPQFRVSPETRHRSS
ncbi:Zn-ribbon domain-containing OB-fold protein [Rhodococcus sp. F64268]|uniref:Zn-ribbon domain-containing OB-fold protein n=1 Tax=Rhodococcus sp. F64268 TaxID=2926402 RepID=UPI001FF35753|nr:Zn-ribbon domain-containing OB-fold protein [Rhodococcus sp. F64268]MCK0090713.1 Zn-ribbon domain-containing OB-fold protein [Rhodococcus sp. F64268]